MATICALAVVLAGVAAYGWHVGWFAKSTSNGNTTTPQTSQTSALPRTDVPSPKKNDDPAAQAQRAVSAMTLEERVGQLVMVPLFAGSDPSSLASTIADEHTRIQFVSATLVFGLAAFDCSLAISSSHTSLGVL